MYLKLVFILGATYPSISSNNLDPDVISLFFKGANIYYPFESSYLKAFLNNYKVYISLNKD